MAECTIYDKLRYISETKDLIKMAIESQDVEVLESATFRQYAEYITEIRKVSSVNGMQGDVVLTIGDLDGYTKEEIDNLLKDVDVDLSDYYTKKEIDEKGYLTEVPVATTETDGLMSADDKEFIEAAVYGFGAIETKVFNNDTQMLITLPLNKKNKTQSKGYLELNSGQHFKTINGQPILGSGDIVIESGGSVDLDLFEVVTELPTENIDENKIYLIKDPTASNKEVIVEGHMTPSTDYNWDGKDTYIQDEEATIDGTTINNDKRTRVTLRGFEGETTIMLGLSFAPMDVIAEQLYIQLQHLNEDTSGGKPDHWNFRDSGQVGEGVSWTTIGLGSLEPDQEYFFDIWTNGGQASVGGMDFYLPSYIAVPKGEKSGSQFIEYIYNNGEWEELGKNIKMVDPKAYCSIGVDPNGFNGKSYAVFSRADGNGDILEVAKINGKTMIGWEAKEFSLAETKEVTQEEYDALTPEDGVIYIITDAMEMGIPTKLSQLENDSKFISESNLNEAINEVGDVIEVLEGDIAKKQDILVSGTNIKTINGNSLLGEGDITIEGGTNLKLQEGSQGTEGNYIYSYVDIPVSPLTADLSKAVLSRYRLSTPSASEDKITMQTRSEWWGGDAAATEEVYFPIATNEQAGAITAADKAKLDEMYSKEEIDALIGGVETKITELNDMI